MHILRAADQGFPFLQAERKHEDTETFPFSFVTKNHRKIQKQSFGAVFYADRDAFVFQAVFNLLFCRVE